MKNQFWVVLVFTSVYAVIRYAVFGTVSLIHVPVYIMNKGISMTAAVSLFMASLCLVRRERDTARFWTNACSQSAFVHVFLSLGIFSKAYFHKLFSGDKLNLTGEVTLLFGVLAAYCIWRLNTRVMKTAEWRITTASVYALVASHLFAMSYDGWLQVQKWNGALPPDTLLSFLFVICGLMTFLRSKDGAFISLPVENNIKPAIEP
jgi:hypothetical protein